MVTTLCCRFDTDDFIVAIDGHAHTLSLIDCEDLVKTVIEGDIAYDIEILLGKPLTRKFKDCLDFKRATNRFGFEFSNMLGPITDDLASTAKTTLFFP